MACKGRCDFDEKFHNRSWKFPYSDGYKQCTSCEKVIKIDGFKCPCCNASLRTKTKQKQRVIKIHMDHEEERLFSEDGVYE